MYGKKIMLTHNAVNPGTEMYHLKFNITCAHLCDRKIFQKTCLMKHAHPKAACCLRVYFYCCQKCFLVNINNYLNNCLCIKSM